jgi:hypothetical protein
MHNNTVGDGRVVKDKELTSRLARELDPRAWGIALPDERLVIERITSKEAGFDAVIRVGAERFHVISEEPSRAQKRIERTCYLSSLDLADTDLVWHDGSGFAVYSWVSGAPLFQFDCRPEVLVDAKLMMSLARRLAGWHSHTFDKFSAVECEPAVFKSRLLERVMISRENYANFLMIGLAQSTSLILGATGGSGLINRDEASRVEKCVNRALAALSDRVDELLGVPSFSLVHGDLHHENILVDGREIHFVDYEDVHVGDRALEIAFLLENFCQGPLLSNEQEVELISYYAMSLAEHLPSCPDENLASRVQLYRVFVAAKFTLATLGGFSCSRYGAVNRQMLEFYLHRSEVLTCNR